MALVLQGCPAAEAPLEKWPSQEGDLAAPWTRCAARWAHMMLPARAKRMGQSQEQSAEAETAAWLRSRKLDEAVASRVDGEEVVQIAVLRWAGSRGRPNVRE